jgi:DivIVA domain-containing protein
MTAMSPEEIETASFPTRADGYDRGSVEEFLKRVADAFRRGGEESLGVDPYRRLGKDVGALLQHAHEAAERMRQEAEQALWVAEREAQTTVESARQEAARLTKEAQRRAEEVRSRAQAEADELIDDAEKLKRLARADATVVAREAKRAAEQVREEALRDAERKLAAAQEDARLRTEKSERRVRRLQDLEFALSQRLNAAQAKLHTLSPDGSEKG